ncbi:plasmid recombination protein [Burkholderia aenigmatica]|uniref:plasmid recombination protein n=1 Tax=Burkholderia aenigmatica TaxID=2015348 RepID=UPI00264C770E|nr:plasmid recombination protein [Burkholderia aenigmatica]MDN7880512.1 plasmid recombination protein [Burkholderia aenigmatica]
MPHTYNILRTTKVKTRSDITNASEHNFRLRMQSNIDASKTHLNKVLLNTLGADVKQSNSLQIKLTEFYQSLGIKEKKDNVLMMEFIVSASPEFFAGKNQAEVEKWANHQIGFFQKEFGEQVKIAVLHLDETTPHLHIMIGTEVKSVKNYKNRYGMCQKETWSLNADRYNPQFLTDLHTKHYEWNKKPYPKLKRGVKGSMREHKSLKQFYEVVDKALSTNYEKAIQDVLDSLETGFLSGKVSISEVKDKFAPMIHQLLKQNKALKEKYALDLKEMLEEINAREIRLTAEEKILDERKAVYSNFIKKIDEKDSEIKTLKAENERLRKLLPKAKSELEPSGNKFNQKLAI